MKRVCEKEQRPVGVYSLMFDSAAQEAQRHAIEVIVPLSLVPRHLAGAMKLSFPFDG